MLSPSSWVFFLTLLGNCDLGSGSVLETPRIGSSTSPVPPTSWIGLIKEPWKGRLSEDTTAGSCWKALPSVQMEFLVSFLEMKGKNTRLLLEEVHGEQGSRIEGRGKKPAREALVIGRMSYRASGNIEKRLWPYLKERGNYNLNSESEWTKYLLYK